MTLNDMMFLNSSWAYYQQRQLIVALGLFALVMTTVWIESIIIYYAIKKYNPKSYGVILALTITFNLVTYGIGVLLVNYPILF